jgi:hypothetical protein
VILLDELVETVVAEGVAAGKSNGFLEDISAESTGEQLLAGVIY